MTNNNNNNSGKGQSVCWPNRLVVSGVPATKIRLTSGAKSFRHKRVHFSFRARIHAVVVVVFLCVAIVVFICT